MLENLRRGLSGPAGRIALAQQDPAPALFP